MVVLIGEPKGVQWTEKLFRPSGGQDHLGLASVASDRILPKLSPGIIVQTVHPRYLSFYTFLLDEFWRRDLPRTKDAFAQFFRPREAIYAIAANLCDRPEHSSEVTMPAIVGSIKAGGVARSGALIFDAGLDYIKNDLGGYGLYYGSMIADFGLTMRAQPEAGLPYDAPTPKGHALANAFRAAIADTDYYRDYFADDDAQVPRQIAVDYIRKGCLCQLQLDSAPDRALLRDTYLHAGEADQAGGRRETLRMVLDLAEQTAGHALTEDRFRQLVYYRADTEGASWAPSHPAIRMARRWRLYQAREYYAFALNRLWRYIVEWGQGRVSVSGDWVAQATWWEWVDANLHTAPLARAFDVADPGLDAGSPLEDLATWAIAEGRVGGDLDAPWDVAASLVEHAIYRWASRNAEPGVVLGSMAMLALVANRIGAPQMQAAYADDWDICLDGGVARLAINRFLRQWNEHRAAGASIGETARWLIEDNVLRQHERIAVAKLEQTGDTFRFRREGDGIRFYEADAPANMSNSRFLALATTIHELGFVGSLYAPERSLSGDGRTLLEVGDLPDVTVVVEPSISSDDGR